MNLRKFKDFLDKNPAYLATTNYEGEPNLTIVRAKVISDNELLIADVQMEKCKKNLLLNPKCCLTAYKEKEKLGLKVFGTAKYYFEGKYFEEAKELAEKRKYKAIGAIVIRINKLMY